MRLVEELLTAAQLEREGAVRQYPELIDLSVLVAEVVRDFEGGPTVDVVGPRSCQVVGDGEILRRVLTNLVDNAMKHGEPPVRILMESSAEEVTVRIRDHGPGVPAADRERIFERFTRLDQTGNRPGIGLGLPIVRELLAACDGRVWVDEAPGGGAEFGLALPMRLPERVRR